MKNISDEQFEQDMNLFLNAKQVDAPNFFYTILNARMDRELKVSELAFPIKPILIICTLTLFILINSLLLKKDMNYLQANPDQNMEALATSYDQTISN